MRFRFISDGRVNVIVDQLTDVIIWRGHFPEPPHNKYQTKMRRQYNAGMQRLTALANLGYELHAQAGPVERFFAESLPGDPIKLERAPQENKPVAKPKKVVQQWAVIRKGSKLIAKHTAKKTSKKKGKRK